MCPIFVPFLYIFEQMNLKHLLVGRRRQPAAAWSACGENFVRAHLRSMISKGKCDFGGIEGGLVGWKNHGERNAEFSAYLEARTAPAC